MKNNEKKAIKFEFDESRRKQTNVGNEALNLTFQGVAFSS